VFLGVLSRFQLHWQGSLSFYVDRGTLISIALGQPCDTDFLAQGDIIKSYNSCASFGRSVNVQVFFCPRHLEEVSNVRPRIVASWEKPARTYRKHGRCPSHLTLTVFEIRLLLIIGTYGPLIDDRSYKLSDHGILLGAV